MANRTTLYIGVSLDGYVADRDGGVDWMVGDGSQPDHQGSYQAFLSKIDTVIMGRRTYDQIREVLSPEQWTYANQTTYVLTHHHDEDRADVRFRDLSLQDVLTEAREQGASQVWLCGGAQLVHQAIELDLIDCYHISILPVILGQGIPLFSKGARRSLSLIKTKSYNGIVDVIYERRT